MKVPKEVIQQAQELIDRYDGYIERLGVYKHQDVYIYKFREAVIIGLPEVYLWDGKRCKRVFGENAFKIIDALI